MKKKAKRILVGALVAMALLQLTNPARTNPPVEPGRDVLATNAPPAKISAMLHASCYDCHSHETKWPWYSRVAPVSWLVVGDVNKGRVNLNFSNWPHDRARRARKNWENIADEVRSGRMPMPKYVRLHSEAGLTADDRELIAQWAEEEAKRLKALETD